METLSGVAPIENRRQNREEKSVHRPVAKNTQRRGDFVAGIMRGL